MSVLLDPPRRSAAAPVPAPPSSWWFEQFGRYCRWYLRRHFHAVRVSPAHRPDRATAGAEPSLIYLNHPSWWDPITCLFAARTLLPGRHHHGPMDARMLQRYGILRKVGLFGLDTTTRAGAAQFLQTADALLQRPRTTLWVTAEGQFTDPRPRPVRLAPGIGHLVRRRQAGYVQPMAVEYVFWDQRTPELLVRFGEPIDLAHQPPGSAADWTQRLADRLSDTMDHLAADAAARNPAAFDTLLSGRAGVGGVYDLYRRSKALLTGQRFVPEHGAA